MKRRELFALFAAAPAVAEAATAAQSKKEPQSVYAADGEELDQIEITVHSAEAAAKFKRFLKAI